MFDIITFDCYGTLVDWESGISSAIMGAARRHGMRLEPEAVMAAYHRVEPEAEAGEFRPYREVLARSASATARRLGWALEISEAGFLAESLPDWPVFEDTNGALEQLKDAGHRLGILSNVDPDLLERTLEHFTVSFDLLVTAADVESYKPALPHFARAKTLIGNKRWLHAAQSYFHDIVPASGLGIPVVWVNRKGERPAGAVRPDGEVGNLRGLVEWLDRRPPAS
ncbi:MAG: HAD family hydrolase [Gemmatimonadales bacterium]